MSRRQEHYRARKVRKNVGERAEQKRFFAVHGAAANQNGTCAEGSPPGQTPLTPPPSAPWVFLGTFGVTCPNDTVNTATDTIASIASGKSNFQANTPTPGTYQFNWQTVKGSTGCVALVLQYDTGIQVFQAIFKYSKT